MEIREILDIPSEEKITITYTPLTKSGIINICRKGKASSVASCIKLSDHYEPASVCISGGGVSQEIALSVAKLVAIKEHGKYIVTNDVENHSLLPIISETCLKLVRKVSK
ncbi:hypothetical protein ADUPG1_008158 [Aduncisulcus paluster]|uniref:Uncharacterized protein n=1 Tax=Aduncisulcus paluster TaxID=2918883 RepID=A0ABQ5KSA4_9EUKA|nr:hypothetical protein ADUPG1_008158 [Aduncisulcus paluster]